MSSATPHLEYLLRTLPVSDAGGNRDTVYSLTASSAEIPPQLKTRLEFPLSVMEDTEKRKKFIACEMNRLGSSHRSPWSNKYFPPVADETAGLPSDKSRSMEIEANELFESYKDLYYMGGIQGTSSVYIKDTDHGFDACFLIKKNVEDHEYVHRGVWESANYVTATFNESKTEAVYKLTTSVMINMGVKRTNVGDTAISGLLSRHTETSSRVDADRTPISVIGRMIEDVETEVRQSLNDLYVLKTKEIIDSLRSNSDAVEAPPQSHMDTLNSAVLQLGLRKDEHIVGGP